VSWSIAARFCLEKFGGEVFFSTCNLETNRRMRAQTALSSNRMQVRTGLETLPWEVGVKFVYCNLEGD